MNRWFVFLALSGHGECTAKYSILGMKRTNIVAAYAVVCRAVMLNFV